MAITGAFKTTPTKALDMVLNLNPLHIFIQQEAAKALYRLKVQGIHDDNRPKTRHTNLELSDELLRRINMMTDEMPSIKIFKRNYKTQIPTREEWKQNTRSPSADCLIWYTDGSKTEAGTGAGIYSESLQLQLWSSLGQYSTVFQTEMYAIIACAEENLKRKVENKTIYILSDSQASIKALISCKVNSRLVLNAVKSLNRLGRKNKVRLIWVPGHEGIPGNEKADELARIGSGGVMFGPEPCLGLPACTIKKAIMDYADEKHRQEWEISEGLLHSKKFIGSSTKGAFNFIMNNGRTKTRAVIGALTGHYKTNDMLYKMKITSNGDCRACGDLRETMEHILCECDVLATKRMSLLGNAFPKPEDYRFLPLGGIAAYLNHFFKE